jgi:hypothetical protein
MNEAERLEAFERDLSAEAVDCLWCGDDMTRLRGDASPARDWRCIKCGLELRITAPPQRKWSPPA